MTKNLVLYGRDSVGSTSDKVMGNLEEAILLAMGRVSLGKDSVLTQNFRPKLNPYQTVN